MSSSKDPRLWKVLDRIKKVLELDEKDFAEFLQLRPNQYEKARSQNREVSARSIIALSKQINLGYDQIMTGSIDFRTLSKHFKGEKGVLPKKYSVAAFSKRRTSIYMMDFVEKHYGWEERLAILNRFQMNETLLSNPDEHINLRFPMDICDYLMQYKMAHDELIEIGMNSSKSGLSPIVAGKLKEAKWVGEVYEQMCYEILGKYYEQNYNYRLSNLNRDGCIFVGQPNPMAAELLRLKHVGNPAICLVRQGVIAAMPQLGGRPLSEVRKISCVHEGDAECRFEVRFMPDLGIGINRDVQGAQPLTAQFFH